MCCLPAAVNTTTGLQHTTKMLETSPLSSCYLVASNFDGRKMMANGLPIWLHSKRGGGEIREDLKCSFGVRRANRNSNMRLQQRQLHGRGRRYETWLVQRGS